MHFTRERKTCFATLPAVEKLNSIVHEKIRFFSQEKISFALETVHATSSKFCHTDTFSTAREEMAQQLQNQKGS